MDPSFRFSSDTAEVDRELVHRWLSEHTYWAKGQCATTQDAAIDGSRNFGVYEVDSGRQVAYARVVTDGATFAWLCDVFVAPELRGRGIGVGLVAGVIAEFEPMVLRRMLLATRDAHGLYSKFGFAPLDVPSKWMMRSGE